MRGAVVGGQTRAHVVACLPAMVDVGAHASRTRKGVRRRVGLGSRARRAGLHRLLLWTEDAAGARHGLRAGTKKQTAKRRSYDERLPLLPCLPAVSMARAVSAWLMLRALCSRDAIRARSPSPATSVLACATGSLGRLAVKLVRRGPAAVRDGDCDGPRTERARGVWRWRVGCAEC